MDASLSPTHYADIETSSDAYAGRFSGEAGRWLLERQNSIIRRMLDSYPVNSILDVGGGHGQIASAFVNEDFKITVVGSAPECSKQIEDLRRSGACSFEVGDIEKLPYPDKSFDVVTCIRYLSHTENWQGVISELCRVSRRAVIVDYPTLLSVNFLTPLLFKIKKRLEGNTRPYGIFTHQAINEAFRKNGFRKEACQAQFFFPMVIHRVLKSPSVSSALEFVPRVSGLTRLFGSPALACFTPTAG